MELTQAIVKELLHCDPESGRLWWKKRDVKWFVDGERTAVWNCNVWNSTWAGKETFVSKNLHGYLNATVLNKVYRAHRIVWLWVHGECPEQIDHINGIRHDNRICNLRAVDIFENSKNLSLKKNNKTGVIGVSLSNRGLYEAYITVKQKRTFLGYFETLEEAAQVRKEAEKKNGFHENHGKNLQH